MKLKVIEDRNIAFAGFVRNAIHYSIYEWIRKWQKGPLKEVSEKLLREIPSLSNFYLTFEDDPSRDVLKWSEKSLLLIKQLKKIHDNEWKRYRKEIKTFAKTHKKIIRKYGNFLLRIIPRITKIQWQYDEILVVPSVYYGATTEDNKIFRGVVGKSFKELTNAEERLPGLIHELIHVNTLPKFLSRYSKEKLSEFVMHEKSQFKNPNATIEIATMLTANQVVKLTEQEFDIKLEMQKTHPHYKKVIAKIEKDFDSFESAKGFAQIRKSIDKLIEK